MSTACIIAVADADFATTGKWQGVMHHHDGSHMAEMLYDAFRGNEIVGTRNISGLDFKDWPEWRGKYVLSDMFAGKLNEMFSFILSHKAGWSSLWAKPCHCDLPPRPAGKGPLDVSYREFCQCSTELRCYCHWVGRESTFERMITPRNVGRTDAEFVVVVDLATGMGYVGPVHGNSVEYGQPFSFYDPVEPDWEVVTYGEMRMRLFRHYTAKYGEAYSYLYTKCPNGHQWRQGDYAPGDVCKGEPGEWVGTNQRTGKPRYSRVKKCGHIFTLAEGVLPTAHVEVLPDELRLALPTIS